MKTLKTLVYGILGIVSGVYLLNIGFGVAELIPDNIPVAGNLDEAVAVLIF